MEIILFVGIASKVGREEVSLSRKILVEKEVAVRKAEVV